LILDSIKFEFESLSLVSAVKLWNMSLQNTYLTIWKATVYYMIFNMASDILDPVKLNYCPLFKNLLPRKRTGTSTVPCGTPDDSPSRTTVCMRFDKKAEIQFNV
jgi:hypothetical protein